MAGWRVGMMIAKSEHVENVLRFKSNMDSGMFLPLQLAAAKALSLPASWYEEVNELYRSTKISCRRYARGLECSFQKTSRTICLGKSS